MKRLLTGCIISLLICRQAGAFGFGLWDSGGGGFGGGGSLASITDMFNGFNRTSGDSYTGGPTVIADNSGTLITPPVNRMGLEGARFTDSVWYDTASNGTQLWSAQYLRTRKGSVAKYASTYKGWLNEPAATNLCLQSQAFGTTWTQTGLTITANAIAAPDGAVTADTLTATQNDATLVQTPTATTNVPKNWSIYLKRKTGTGAISMSLDGGSTYTVKAITTEWTRVAINQTIAAHSLVLKLATSGDEVYAWQSDLIASAFTQSPIPTTTATVTRPATNYTRPTAGVLRANDWGVWGRVVPSASGAAQGITMLFASMVDTNNQVRVYTDTVGVGISKTVGGVNSIASVAYGIASGVSFEYQAVQSRINGLQFRLKQDGGSWSEWATNADANAKVDFTPASTYSAGNRNSLAQFSGNFPFTAIIQHSDPKAELERLANQYP